MTSKWVMTKVNLPKVKGLDILPECSNYPILGVTYRNHSYEIEYSPRIIRTDTNYEDTLSFVKEMKKGLRRNVRMSTAAEELAIQLSLKNRKDPRDEEEFSDLKEYSWQWTITGLRVPKGYDPHKYETDRHGRKYYPRIVLIGSTEIGEILVPEGNDNVVVEWDGVFGIPKVTSDKKGDIEYGNHTTHFQFMQNLDDIYILQDMNNFHDGSAKCLHIIGGYIGRNTNAGFRPIIGSLPTIVKEPAKINPKDIEEALLKEVRKDYETLAHPEFLKKYKLLKGIY